MEDTEDRTILELGDTGGSTCISRPVSDGSTLTTILMYDCALVFSITKNALSAVLPALWYMYCHSAGGWFRFATKDTRADRQQFAARLPPVSLPGPCCASNGVVKMSSNAKRLIPSSC